MGTVQIVVIKPSGEEKPLDHPRPLYFVGEKPAVTYKKKLYPVKPPGILDLRSATPFPTQTASRRAQASEVQQFRKADRSRLAEAPQVMRPATRATTPDATVAVAIKEEELQPARKKIEWDTIQRSVIEANIADRLLVLAGPGTGKTEVACGRIVALVGQGTRAADIWMISFTRTAVREIGDRINALAVGLSQLRGLSPTTLDSLAYRVQWGAGLRGKPTSFDENIESFLASLDSSEAVKDHLGSLAHLLIDEVQDIVGERAILLHRLIELLPKECGVTLFADPAQAIYGFAGPDGESDGDGENLVSLLRRRRPRIPFREVELTTQHRTSAPALVAIYREVRERVLSESDSSFTKYQSVEEEIRNHADGISPCDIVDVATVEQNAFVLFRRRAEVLTASSMLSSKKIPHRLRLSGLPVPVAPWIAASLGRFTKRRVSESEFSSLWDRHVAGTRLATVPKDDAWTALLDSAGDQSGNQVEIGRLREVLASRPPLDLCLPEIGTAGPMLGTIHAAKGREASVVHLRLPQISEDEEDDKSYDEETRVLFVGASRARAKLFIGNGFRLIGSKNLATGRAFSVRRNRQGWFAQIEVGRSGDIAAAGIAGRGTFSSSAEVNAAQDFLLTCSYGTSFISQNTPFGSEWRYLMSTGDSPDRTIGSLGQNVSADVWAVSRVLADKVGKSPRSPKMLRHLHVIGVCTLAAGDSELSQLHEPWNMTGLVLAPLIVAFTIILP